MEKMKKICKTIKGDRQLLAGMIGIVILLALVILAPVVASENPHHYGKDILNSLGQNGHLLGTNHMGQDIYSMIIYGVRTSLRVAVISALISGVLGVLIGGVAGFFGGKVDTFVSELINVFMMLPSFFLILLIIALFGNSITNVMVVIGITTWPSNAKLMRAQALSLRQRTFVKSAEAMGETKLQILFKYILPNGIFPVIANTTMGMSNAIHRGGAFLPWTWRSKHYQLGADDLYRKTVHYKCMVDFRICRNRYRYYCPCILSVGRRTQSCAESKTSEQGGELNGNNSEVR